MIILKALRKEPARRYETVEQFSEDLRRHLAGLPVTARRDTFSYRAEKFVRRNRGAVVAALLVILAIVGGAAATAWQAVRAERQRALAEKRFGQVRALANNVVFKYQIELEKLPGSVKVREILISDALLYLDSLARDAGDDRALQTELALAYFNIGRVQGHAYAANLGDTNGSIDSYRKGINLLAPFADQITDAKTQGDLISANNGLSLALRRQGSVAEADARLRENIRLAERYHAAKPDDNGLAARLATVYYYVADTLPPNENLEMYRRAATVVQGILVRDPNHVRAVNILAAANDRIGSHLLRQAQTAAELGDAEAARQALDDAAPHYRDALALAERLIALQPDAVLNQRLLAIAKFNQSEFLFQRGQFADALSVQLAALADFQNYAASDPANQEYQSHVGDARASLGQTYARLGDFARSDNEFKQAAEIYAKVIAHDRENLENRQRFFKINYLQADELLKKGETDRAREIYDRAFREIEAAGREKNNRLIESLRGVRAEKIGDCAAAERNRETARAAFSEALDIWERAEVGGDLSFDVQIDKPNRLAILKQKLNRL